MSVAVRQALPADAESVTTLLRRSITELCGADHGNNPRLLAAWLANKTVADVTTWIASPHSYCVVATLGANLAGVGLMSLEGEIRLCYVDPAARFSGVSAALLEALEHKAGALGLTEVRLEATLTARRFYAERGYRARGCTSQAFGLPACQAMAKPL